MLRGTKVPENWRSRGPESGMAQDEGSWRALMPLLSAWAPLGLGCLSPRPWDRVAPQGKRKL